MSKIKIKNFGPIKEGYQENDGWMDIKKVTVFIGNQGSGKSTVAKVISTLTWLEKAINRGDIDKDKISHDYFHKQFEYQGIETYFRDSTEIEYVGNRVIIKYNKALPYPAIEIFADVTYTVPKIMYVPAERNFLSVIENATGVRGLPKPLFEFAEELRRGQYEFGIKDIEIPLPINNVKYKFNILDESSLIVGEDFSVNLLVASSGFQSLVPLYFVSLILANNILNNSEINPNNISVDRSIRMNNEIGKIMTNDKLPNEQKINSVNAVKAKFQNKCFINIVEEPEQNLFPSSQRQLLNSLLEFSNINDGNKLIMTTHSPYLINYLTLAVEANKLKLKVNSDELKNKLDKIVPLASTINGDELAIYELNEKNGSIRLLPSYKGLPSDENVLNEGLAHSNDLFSELLDIEDLCQ